MFICHQWFEFSIKYFGIIILSDSIKQQHHEYFLNENDFFFSIISLLLLYYYYVAMCNMCLKKYMNIRRKTKQSYIYFTRAEL